MGSLISVNVGLPKDVEWHGKIVHTAIWKRSIPGRTMARRLNLDGDGQGDLGGHGGENRAVMVYQLDSYRYWEVHLERRDFEYGQFGENFTVDCLPDSEVCVGDRYRIGNGLFEVTQPRVTCYRIGLRMNNPQMPALLVAHQRPGFYLRVIEEGEIGAGDTIEKVLEGPEGVTISEINALLYLPGHPRDQLQRALRIPSLSPGWRKSLEALASTEGMEKHSGNSGLTSIGPPPAWHGFRPLRVATTHHESINVFSIVLESQDQAPLPAALPGQFLAVRLQTDRGSPAILRSYSLSGPPNANTYRISVKRAEGPGSRYLNDHIQAGALLDVSAPRGNFTLAATSRPIVLLSAGIGITPVLAMLHSLAGNSDGPQREVWWLYGTRNGKEHPFAAETRKLLRDLVGSRSYVMYSKPEPEDELKRQYDASGHLNLSLLKQLGVPQQSDFYLCGPSMLLNDMVAGLTSWGVPESCVHKEVFGPGSSITPGIANVRSAPHQPSGASGTGPSVSFIRSGLSVPWDSRFQSLLEFAEACDVPVRWSCRTGVCHLCECGLIDGSLRYTPEPLDMPADGNALICCSTPTSGIELDL